MLLELINTLGSSEKRYLTVELEKSKNKNLKSLFEYSKSTSSDSILDKLTSNENYHNILPTVKAQLYKFILKQLRSYNEKMNVDAFLRNSSIEIDVLMKKKLYTHALKKTRTAKKKAYDFERFTYLLELLNYEMIILWEVQAPKQYSPEFLNIKEEIKKVESMHSLYIKKKQDYFALRSLNYDLVNFEDYNMHMPLPEIRSGRYFFLLNRIIISLGKRDYDLAFDCTGHLMNLMAVSMHEFKENVAQFIDIMFFCCQASIMKKREDQIDYFYQELKDIKPDSVQNKDKLTERMNFINLLRSKVLGETHNIEEIAEYYDGQSKHLDKLIIQKGYDLLTTVLLENNEYKTANYYNQILLSEAKRRLNKTLLKKALIKELLVAYKVDKLSLMEYRLAAFWKVKSKYNLSESEMSALSNFNKLQNDENAYQLYEEMTLIYL